LWGCLYDNNQSQKKIKNCQGTCFEVVIEPDEDVYHACCPVLRGCHTWGHNEAEAFQFIQEAVRLHLEDMIEDGESIPEIGIADSIN
jgi:predicted RNase H-like HicB family nuclease